MTADAPPSCVHPEGSIVQRGRGLILSHRQIIFLAETYLRIVQELRN